MFARLCKTTAHRLPDSVSEPAPAKVNLYLHILGRRSDGYHELQSLVAFAQEGDLVFARRSDTWSLEIEGPFASPLAPESLDSNLVLRAARRLFAGGGATDAMAATFTLRKNLPVAAGIGGGSADAAAALRCLRRLFGTELGPPEDWASLGADIPVCLLNQPTLVEGMGEKLTTVARIPALPAVLVNPKKPSSTGAVFQALSGRFGAPSADPIPAAVDCQSPATFCAWLNGTRNDLTEAAIQTVPEIATVLAALNGAPEALAARMSGSGATCFGLFPTIGAASAAAGSLSRRFSDWWIYPTILRGSPA